jgi:hypothetical protein
MVCPACGARMEGRACHVSCRRRGYFEDCSDGMLAVISVPTVQTQAKYPILAPAFLSKDTTRAR